MGVRTNLTDLSRGQYGPQLLPATWVLPGVLCQLLPRVCSPPWERVPLSQPGSCSGKGGARPPVS